MLDHASIADAYDELHAAARRRIPFGDLTARDRLILRMRVAERLGISIDQVQEALHRRQAATMINFRAGRRVCHG